MVVIRHQLEIACLRKNFLLLAVCLFAMCELPAVRSQTNVITLTPPAPEHTICENLDTMAIPYCAQVNYSRIGFPNPRGHMNQQQAFEELQDFRPLIDTGCSGAIVHFLCSYYAPLCFTVMQTNMTLLPCRSLCEEVRDKCSYLVQCRNLPWPEHLNCDLFPVVPPCFGPDDPSSLTIPSNISGISVASAVPVFSNCTLGPVVPSTTRSVASTTRSVAPSSSSAYLQVVLTTEQPLMSTATPALMTPSPGSIPSTPGPTLSSPDAAPTHALHVLTALVCMIICAMLL